MVLFVKLSFHKHEYIVYFPATIVLQSDTS